MNSVTLTLSEEEYFLLETAAKRSNLTLEEYILKSTLTRAYADSGETIIVPLHPLIDLLENPPEPTKALKKLFN